MGGERRHEADSAGTQPTDRIHPQVVEVMREWDIDLSGYQPEEADPGGGRGGRRRGDDGMRRRVPYVPGKRYLD